MLNTYAILTFINTKTIFKDNLEHILDKIDVLSISVILLVCTLIILKLFEMYLIDRSNSYYYKKETPFKGLTKIFNKMKTYKISTIIKTYWKYYTLLSVYHFYPYQMVYANSDWSLKKF